MYVDNIRIYMHKAKGTNKKEQDSTIKKAVSEKMTIAKKRQKNKDREKLHDKKFLGLMKKNFM